MEKRKRWGGGEKRVLRARQRWALEDFWRSDGWGVGVRSKGSCMFGSIQWVHVVNMNAGVFLGSAKADSVEKPASNSAWRWDSWLHINRTDTQTKNKCVFWNSFQNTFFFTHTPKIKDKGDRGSGYTYTRGQKEGAQGVIEETRQHGWRSQNIWQRCKTLFNPYGFPFKSSMLLKKNKLRWKLSLHNWNNNSFSCNCA